MKILFVFMLWLNLFECALIAQQDQSIALDVYQKNLIACETQMSAKGLDFPEAVAENTSFLEKIPEFQAIVRTISHDWRNVITHLTDVAPAQTSKIVLIRACQNMRPEQYLQFLDAITSTQQGQRLNRDLLKIAIRPTGRLTHVLADNYQDKDVIRFCQNAKRIWSDNPGMISEFDSILSGETKKNVDAMRQAEISNIPDTKLH